jgi:hypothetical protein
MMVSNHNYSNISLFQVHHNLPSSHAITMFTSFCQRWIEMCYKLYLYKSSQDCLILQKWFYLCLPIVFTYCLHEIHNNGHAASRKSLWFRPGESPIRAMSRWGLESTRPSLIDLQVASLKPTSGAKWCLAVVAERLKGQKRWIFMDLSDLELLHETGLN